MIRTHDLLIVRTCSTVFRKNIYLCFFCIIVSNYSSARTGSLNAMMTARLGAIDMKVNDLATTVKDMELHTQGKKIAIEILAVAMGCLTFLGLHRVD